MKTILVSLMLIGAAVPAFGQNVRITPIGSHPGELCANDRAIVFEDPSGVRLLYDISNYPTDHVDYAGELNGREFAMTAGWDGGPPCRTGARVARFDGAVTGRFSEDGRGIAAKEVWTYSLSSGETFNMHFDWSAER